MNMGYNILVIDDVLDNIQMIMNILDEGNYDLSFATSGEMALELISENDFDMILLDVMMPSIDGFQTCVKIKELPNTADIPIIFITAKADIDSISRAYEVGGVDYIVKPYRKVELLARVSTHLELYRIKEVLKQNNINLQTKEVREKKRIETELEENQQELIYILTEMMEEISNETKYRSRRVAEMSKIMATHLGSMSQEDIDVIYHSAPTYDIGKTLIPQEILSKKTKLSEEELRIIKTHTTRAHEFLSRSQRKHMKSADIMAYQHHEKWDGSGYPLGLKEEEIHIFARIVAVVDVFDALMHKRAYRDAWSSEKAVQYIIQNTGTHFDPELVDIFQANSEEFIAIANS